MLAPSPLAPAPECVFTCVGWVWERRQRGPSERMKGEKRERGGGRGSGRRGGTTFLFSALPGDLKTPPKGPFRLFGAFGDSGRGRLGSVLRLLVAVAPGGLLWPRTAAAELRGGEEAAAAILWRGLRLRKRWLHPVVSAAAAASPAPIRRRGLGLRSSRHGAGVSSSGKLPPTRSTGVRGEKDGGAGPPPDSPLPAPGGRARPHRRLPNVKAAPARRSPPSESRSPPRRLPPQAPATNVHASGPGGGGALAGPLRQWERSARLRECGETCGGRGLATPSPPKGASATPGENVDAVASGCGQGPCGALRIPEPQRGLHHVGGGQPSGVFQTLGVASFRHGRLLAS